MHETSPGLVIFDCDGVLIDSEVLACSVDAEVYTSVGYPMTADDVMRRFVGMSSADIDTLIERELGRSLPPNYDAEATERLFDLFRRELKAIEGVHDLIADLVARDVPVCVASSSTPQRLQLTLGLTKIWDMVAPHVFSATMVARGKPAPDLFQLAARTMGVDPTACLVIEDSATGVTAARAAGMRAIGFCGGSHCRQGHAEKLTEVGAQATYDSMVELRAAIGLA